MRLSCAIGSDSSVDFFGSFWGGLGRDHGGGETTRYKRSKPCFFNSLDGRRQFFPV